MKQKDMECVKMEENNFPSIQSICSEVNFNKEGDGCKSGNRVARIHAIEQGDNCKVILIFNLKGDSNDDNDVSLVFDSEEFIKMFLKSHTKAEKW